MELRDRRVRRTQKLLMDALLALSLEKGFDRVTIRDITERADIAYSTFFRHYSDTDSLLEAMIGEEIETLLQLIGDPKSRSPREIGVLLFEHVKANEAFYRVVLSGSGSNAVLVSVQQRLQTRIGEHYLQSTVFPREIVVQHLVAAIITLIRWWLNSGQTLPVSEMARIYADLIVIPTERAAFQPHL